ncbi:serine/threonine-protein kinase [Nocardioides sp. SYSU DS0663]|uniref:serine/threonine-protein kinase n=1 Tax=Nocardioides sp. SYSU DS0663 TaxID=3416445 RepID=UPI003F4B352F
MIAGRYSLEREIGRGGMGAVWLARDEVLGRPVAVKRVGVVPGGSRPDLERAEREARLAARLSHPHVVAVFDLVDHDSERWLVMEHVPGTTLAELVRTRGPLPTDEAAAMLAQAADALAAAHAAGIVHRDVKPSNMLVTGAGVVKLSDFGIARAEADAALTQTGLVTGSPAYLAPEVASGQSATAQSDMWSLGASLYHALAGRPPYDVGENVLGALFRIVHEDPPELPGAGWLVPVLAGTMTREPGDRWTAAQVRDFLRSGRAPAGSTTARVPAAAPPRQRATEEDDARPSDRHGRRVATAVLGLLALLVVTVAGVSLARDRTSEDDPPPTTATADPVPEPTPTPGASDPPQRPTEAGAEQFVRDYLTTAADDPSAGFAMLTREFQRQSGGLAGYTGFWGRVRSIDGVSRVDADVDGPRDIGVRYSYRWTFDNGETRRDDVRLRLVHDGEDFKIAGES